MGVAASCRILVEGAEAEFRTVLADAVFRATRHLRQRGCMIAIGLVGGDDTCLIGSPDALRAAAKGAAVGQVVGRDEIIHPIDLIDVVPLAHTVTFRDDGALRLFDRSAHVWLQLRTFHFAVAVDGIDLPVVVEEHAEVVDAALHVVVLPRAVDILRGIALQAFAVDVSEYIELPVGIAYGRCPYTLTVDLLMVLQREGIVVEVETVEAVADVLPVHEVLGV